MIPTALAIAVAFWPALAGAAAIGFVVGAAGRRTRTTGVGGRLAAILLVALVLAGGTGAWLGLLDGRPALWLEIGLAATIVYLGCCVLGCAMRAAVSPRASS